MLKSGKIDYYHCNIAQAAGSDSYRLFWFILHSAEEMRKEICDLMEESYEFTEERSAVILVTEFAGVFI